VPDLSIDTIAEAAQQPASGSVDGRSAEAHPIPDQLAALRAKATADAQAGENASGGRRSAWNSTNTGVARNNGAV
jgi:hypothetical protein